MESLQRDPKMKATNVNVHYKKTSGEVHAVINASLDILPQSVLALMGPSGCGKSSFLRCFNRMNDTNPDCRVTGTITLDGQDVYHSDLDVVELRARVGIVFQKANPFPKSIFENVAYGLRIHGLAPSKGELHDIVLESLARAHLLDEVKDRLNDRGTSLSGGQQQRLCIARAIAVSPEVLLMDEPCSALDPIATAKIEELIDELKQKFAIVIVTHNVQQASRVADHAAMFYLGEIIEDGPTAVVFSNPAREETHKFITGRVR